MAASSAKAASKGEKAGASSTKAASQGEKTAAKPAAKPAENPPASPNKVDQSKPAANENDFHPKAANDKSPPATSAVSAQKLKNKLIAEEITGGHAYPKHAKEFGFSEPKQMQQHIEKVLEGPAKQLELKRGRTAFWDDKTSSVIIRNPKAPDGGTTFVPKDGYKYFLKDLQ